MAERLSLILQADLAHVHWYVIGDRITEGQCHLDDLAQALPTKSLATTVLWPIEQAAVHQVTIPPGQQRNLAKILPFAIEEYLAQELEQVHLVALSNKVTDGQLPVAVIERQRLSGVIDQLEQQGIALKRIELISQAYQRVVNTPALLLYPDHGIWLGDIAFAGHPSLVIDYAVQHSDQLTLYSDSPQQSTEVEIELVNHDLHVEQGSDPLDTIERTCATQNIGANQVGNFLQGDYARQDQSPLSGLPWQPLAGAVALLFVIATTFLSIEAIHASRQAASYEAAIESVFAQAMGEETRFRPQRWRQQVEQLLALQGEGAASGFIPVTRLVANTFERFPSLTIEQLSYTATRDQLTLLVEAEQLAPIEAFERALSATTLSVERTIEQRQGRAVGSFTVTGAAE